MKNKIFDFMFSLVFGYIFVEFLFFHTEKEQ